MLNFILFSYQTFVYDTDPEFDGLTWFDELTRNFFFSF
jgi:hypothetical protein